MTVWQCGLFCDKTMLAMYQAFLFSFSWMHNMRIWERKRPISSTTSLKVTLLCPKKSLYAQLLSRISFRELISLLGFPVFLSMYHIWPQRSQTVTMILCRIFVFSLHTYRWPISMDIGKKEFILSNRCLNFWYFIHFFHDKYDFIVLIR